jgi:PAS domain S-box-containing protein
MRSLGAARTLDNWFRDHDADASALAEIAATRPADSSRLDPALAARILHTQMDALQQRGEYVALWMVDSAASPRAAVGDRGMSAAESRAAIAAMRNGRTTVGQFEQLDSSVTVSIATPIFAAGKATAAHQRATAATVMRIDLNRSFNTTTPPTTAGAVSAIVAPNGNQTIGIRRCSRDPMRFCLVGSDSLGMLAVHRPDYAGDYIAPDGTRFIVATHHTTTLPWTAYTEWRVDSLLAPVYDRLRFEAALLLGILVVGGLAFAAYYRSAQLRGLVERAQTEAGFAAIVNTAMDAIIIVDERYTITLTNSAADAMFGFAADEIRDRPVLDLIPEVNRDELRRTLDQTLREGEQPRLFNADRYISGCRSSGSTFPIDVSVSRTHVDGRPQLTIVIRDITDWKRAEDSSEWQRRVLESIATGIDLRDVLTTIVRFHETQTPGVEGAVHLIDDDGLTLRTRCAPSMRPEFVEAMDEVVVGPTAATCGAAVYRRELVVSADITTDRVWNDYRALALEQGYRACWGVPIRSPQGRVLGALVLYVRETRSPLPQELRVTAAATQLAGIAVDRAYAAESLRQSEASFRSFVENSPIGIYRATGTGRLLAVNASLVQLLGYNSALELLQVDMAHELFVNQADRERLVRQLQAHGELRSTEMEWRRKDGATVTVRVSARAYRDERGAVWFSEGFVENVTPLRAAELALRQSEKLAALGQLVSGVAHELNNPLAAILHFAEDLLDDERSATDHEAISVIRDQARRSRAIVRDLLSFVRFRDAARERVHITEALHNSVRALQPIVAEQGARLVVELTPRETFGNSDRAGLQQIVTNLVVNAAQASGQGGVVRLMARIVEQDLVLIVDDTGPGVPPKLMDRIFEPFFTTKPLGQGTGLGLSVTLGVAQQLGGKITVENKAGAEGTGARFTVTLPIEGTVAEAPRPTPRSISAADAPSGNGTAKLRVLIIDDEAPIRAALRRFFTRRGWVVAEAEDGAEGLSVMLNGKSDFAVIISDLKMPGCSGVELHDHVATMAPELLDRIIFSTGDVASKDAAEFVARTRCMVMQKPFELRALEAVVARMREMATA